MKPVGVPSSGTLHIEADSHPQMTSLLVRLELC